MLLLSLEAFGRQGNEAGRQKESAAKTQRVNLIPYRKGNKWGFSDASKKLVIQPEYAGASFFSEGLAGVVLNGKVG